MREFDVFVPLHYNDGSPIEARKFQRLHTRLLDHFGGVTFFPQPNKGSWKMGDVVYHDEVVVYRFVTGNLQRARRFIAKLKEDLKRTFRQEEIFIVSRPLKRE